MSLADNPAAITAAIEAEREAATKYTLMDIRQGPGEGNYDRVQELRIKDMLRAAEEAHIASAPTIQFVSVDEADTLVLEDTGEDEGA